MKEAEKGKACATTEQPASFDEFDEMNDPRPARTDFHGLAKNAASRRGFLDGTTS